MTGFFMFLHGIIAVLLVVIILMQSGRGGGLTESFASAESMFGAKTNEFMIKATTVFATLFFVTCLSLAVTSSQKGKSLMSGKVAPETQVSDTQTLEDILGDMETIELDMPGGDTTLDEMVKEPQQEALVGDVPVSTAPDGQ